MGKLSYKDKLRMQTLREHVHLTSGWSWALLRKSADESTALAQPTVLHKAVSERHLSVSIVNKFCDLHWSVTVIIRQY